MKSLPVDGASSATEGLRWKAAAPPARQVDGPGCGDMAPSLCTAGISYEGSAGGSWEGSAGVSEGGPLASLGAS